MTMIMKGYSRGIATVAYVLALTGAALFACSEKDAEGTTPSDDAGVDRAAPAIDGTAPQTDGGGPADGSDLPLPAATGTFKFAVTVIADNIVANDVTYDALGNVFLGGGYSTATAVDFGNGKVLSPTTGSYVGFVAKFDATGKCLWVTALTGENDGEKKVVALAAAPNGDVVFAADTGGATSVQLDKAAIVTSAYAFVAVGRLDAAGHQVWLRAPATTGQERPTALAVDASGRIALAGNYVRDTATDPAFDGVTANPPQHVQAMGFLALLNAQGVTQSLKAFPNPDNGLELSLVYPHAVSFTPDGNVVVAGDFSGKIELRNGEPTSQTVPSAGSTDAWIAKVDSSTNTTMWATTAGGTKADYINSIGVGSTGSVTAAFSYGSSPLTIGGTAFPPPSGIAVIRYDADGGMPESYPSPSLNPAAALKVVVDRWGEPVVVGRMSGDLFLGGSVVATAAGGTDGFIAKLSPTGTGLWAYGVGASDGEEQLNSVAVDSHGNVAAAGSLAENTPFKLFGQTIDIPPGKNAALLLGMSP